MEGFLPLPKTTILRGELFLRLLEGPLTLREFVFANREVVVPLVEVLLQVLEGLLHLLEVPSVGVELPAFDLEFLRLLLDMGLRFLELLHLRLHGASDVRRSDPFGPTFVRH